MNKPTRGGPGAWGLGEKIFEDLKNDSEQFTVTNLS
jgi:hypothetical protein